VPLDLYIVPFLGPGIRRCCGDHDPVPIRVEERLPEPIPIWIRGFDGGDARGDETHADLPNLVQCACVEDQKIFFGTAAWCDRTGRELKLTATRQREEDAVVSFVILEAATWLQP
jgi:hypothetical protein